MCIHLLTHNPNYCSLTMSLVQGFRWEFAHELAQRTIFRSFSTGNSVSYAFGYFNFIQVLCYTTVLVACVNASGTLYHVPNDSRAIQGISWFEQACILQNPRRIPACSRSTVAISLFIAHVRDSVALRIAHTWAWDALGLR